jgi:hypothetical protein
VPDKPTQNNQNYHSGKEASECGTSGTSRSILPSDAAALGAERCVLLKQDVGDVS